MKKNKAKSDTNTMDDIAITMKDIKYKKYLKITLAIVELIILFIAIILIYLHNSQFKYSFSEIKFNDYYKNKNINPIINIEENNIFIEIPSDVITTAFNEQIKKTHFKKGYTVKDGYINTKEKKAYINMTMYGINIPIAMDIKLEINKRDLIISFKNFKLRDKKILSLTNNYEKKLINTLIKDKDILTISLDDFKIPEITNIKDIILKENKAVVVLTVDEKKINEVFSLLSKEKSDELYGIYKKIDGDIEKKTVLFIDKNTIIKSDIEKILSDVLLSDEKLIKNILILSEEYNIDAILNVYGKYITHFNKEDVINEKNKLVLSKIETHCTTLIKQVKELPQDKYIIFLNNPYSIEDNKEITIENIVEKYKLSIPQDIYSKMNFLYNYENKNFMIAYRIDDKQYAIVDNNNYSFINSYDYSKYEFNQPLKNSVQYNKEIKELIADYFSDEVFIRYMNTDGKYAYVIASNASNYQDYERFALEKKDKWEIIDANIIDLYSFSTKYKGFNIKTITDNYIYDKAYKLSKADKFAVLDQLEYRGIIPDKKEVGIKYCSFDGKYISVKLTNDEEYVFSIRYSYLDKVYTKDIAIKKWTDISPLILLQNE
jgi:hypothetical protein